MKRFLPGVAQFICSEIGWHYKIGWSYVRTRARPTPGTIDNRVLVVRRYYQHRRTGKIRIQTEYYDGY